MGKFNPALLVPAQQAPEFSKVAAGRTVQQVAIDNIDRMRDEFSKVQNGEKLERKANFKVAGQKVSFTIRVNNSALVLGQYEQNGVTADVKEMAVPAPNFMDALSYFADKIKAGEFDVQLAALSEKREARTSKMRQTRAGKKAESTKD